MEHADTKATQGMLNPPSGSHLQNENLFSDGKHLHGI